MRRVKFSESLLESSVILFFGNNGDGRDRHLFPAGQYRRENITNNAYNHTARNNV